MSFSFGVLAATKEAAKQEAEVKMRAVVEQQPVHEKDCGAVLSVVDMQLAVIPEANQDQDVSLSVNGYLSWVGQGSTMTITGASVSVAANVVSKKPV